MKLTLTEIINRSSEFIVPSFISNTNKKKIPYPHYFAFSEIYDIAKVQKIKPVFACNPKLDSDKPIWRNVSPIKGYIRDCSCEYGDWECVEKFPDFYKGSKGYFLFLEKSFYNNWSYDSAYIFDLETAIPSPQTAAKALSEAKSNHNQYLGDYFAIFETEEEARKYIYNIKKTTPESLENMEKALAQVENDIKELTAIKENILKNIEKWKKKYGQEE